MSKSNRLKRLWDKILQPLTPCQEEDIFDGKEPREDICRPRPKSKDGFRTVCCWYCYRLETCAENWEQYLDDQSDSSDKWIACPVLNYARWCSACRDKLTNRNQWKEKKT